MSPQKLTPADARDCRILRYCGFTIGDLADLYGVSWTAIAKLVRGFTYRDAGGPVELFTPNAERELPPHGTHARYSYWRCRCRPCRESNAARVAAWREQRRPAWP